MLKNSWKYFHAYSSEPWFKTARLLLITILEQLYRRSSNSWDEGGVMSIRLTRQQCSMEIQPTAAQIAR